MCVSPQGDQRLQLVRQLTAGALNCIVSGGGADCSGTSVDQLFADCNAACVGNTRQVGFCIDTFDCLNNGGFFDGTECHKGTCANGATCGDNEQCPDGSACSPLENNCHDQPLENEELGIDFEPPGPAGSTAECNDAKAKKQTCTVIPPGEATCGTDTCP